MTIHHITGKKPKQKTKQDAKRWRLLLQLVNDSKASITIDGFEFTKEWLSGVEEYFDATIEERDKQEHAEKEKERRKKRALFKARDNLKNVP